MKVIAQTGHEDHAIVTILETASGHRLECVESVQPPAGRDEKWVLLVSTLFGCPIGCPMCDAGGNYHGKPTLEEVIGQIDFMVDKRYPDRRIPCRQFKIQFARMGDPCLNPVVPDVLRLLPERYDAPGLMPSVSTIAPVGCEAFLARVLEMKNRLYSRGRFQFQFSIHSTDSAVRRRLIPAQTLPFRTMAEFGDRFVQAGDRKITLNFAVVENISVDAAVLLRHFSPERFLVKLTPVNPTYRAVENGLTSAIDPLRPVSAGTLTRQLQDAGFDVILSIGNPEENRIGSNCGQFLRSHQEATAPLTDGYQYPIFSD
ncbi:radical SAM protein [bacterium]|nr:radical SAM protein [candidate division CSSED10-310 bacterium]